MAERLDCDKLLRKRSSTDRRFIVHTFICQQYTRYSRCKFKMISMNLHLPLIRDEFLFCLFKHFTFSIRLSCKLNSITDWRWNKIKLQLNVSILLLKTNRMRTQTTTKKIMQKIVKRLPNRLNDATSKNTEHFSLPATQYPATYSRQLSDNGEEIRNFIEWQWIV